MATSKIIYKGNLRAESTHVDSGTVILTDAPKDNHGNGEAFSPTDMVANSLATCIFSIMGIKAREMQVNLDNSTAEVTKVMYSDPRRIGEIIIDFTMVGTSDVKQQIILERVAKTCPVYLSLHPDIEKKISFTWL